MKTQLILALTLSVLAANTFAADGFDKTGAASFGANASAAIERSPAGHYAADGFDKTGTADAIAADGFDKTGTADAIAADGFDKTGTAEAIG
ncbi:hypothetical protein SAMN03159443_05401 [Pseudomonas sp. NFACC15-1]|uniref:hypothetical protein n=1 Tax=unclassified Pseudomonas TaxID=196821 RepID=UPI00088A021A|nr:MULTISPECIES: hypothetical protein [unclassified Pseudomonas]SDA95206.1 hypothetical protein SAMN03159443_05401 [Pseudomonas sp. NFACC15-1]SDX44563.1 hypothetical protein SAMN03159380_02276 [Pseudomonas sp. NFACC14]